MIRYVDAVTLLLFPLAPDGRGGGGEKFRPSNKKATQVLLQFTTVKSTLRTVRVQTFAAGHGPNAH